MTVQRQPTNNDVQIKIPQGTPPGTPDPGTNGGSAQPDQAAINAAILDAINELRAGIHAQQPPPQAMQDVMNDQAYQNELRSFQAKAKLREARIRAERPAPVLSIATEDDQLSVHIHAWRVAKYVGVAVLVSVATYGLFLLVREGVKWVARRIGN